MDFGAGDTRREIFSSPWEVCQYKALSGLTQASGIAGAPDSFEKPKESGLVQLIFEKLWETGSVAKTGRDISARPHGMWSVLL
ncbi:hypothetical protein NBH08_29610 [Faecalicatena sp. BF-R-105]|jgi:hypothetical protein|nr:hypothetical protein [Faecalicatena sp. BF-R-105]